MKEKRREGPWGEEGNEGKDEADEGGRGGVPIEEELVDRPATD